MSLSGLLLHQVEVYRRSGKRDRFGQQVDVNPRQHVVGENIVHTYPCRTYQKSGGLVMAERAVDTFERRWVIFTEPDVDIHEDDAVRVTDPATGRELVLLSKIDSLSLIYDSLGAHHMEITVWSQGGPA